MFLAVPCSSSGGQISLHKSTFIITLNHVLATLIFSNTFRSPPWPTQGVLQQQYNSYTNNTTKIYNKSTQRHDYISYDKKLEVTKRQIYKFTFLLKYGTTGCVYVIQWMCTAAAHTITRHSIVLDVTLAIKHIIQMYRWEGSQKHNSYYIYA